MRVLVVTSDVPFVEGGHRIIARSLVTAFREFGHECEILCTPQNRFGRQFTAYLATTLTDVGMDGLGRAIDLVVSLRFPSYAVRHENHVCWLNHRMREYYDLWDGFRKSLSTPGLVKETVRRAFFHTLDRYLLTRNVKRLYAQSRTIQSRLSTWGRIPSVVLHPPPPQRSYRTDDYERFIFCPSRLEPLKRLDLLLEAVSSMRDKGLKLVISGDGSLKGELEKMVADKGLGERVVLTGFLSEPELVEHYARCLAVYFAPYHEDYGFIVPEAFCSRKPVLTCTDTGGAAELVEDGLSGFVCAPDPFAVAEKLDLLSSRPGLAEDMGDKGHGRVSGLSWSGVVDEMITGKYHEEQTRST